MSEPEAGIPARPPDTASTFGAYVLRVPGWINSLLAVTHVLYMRQLGKF